MACGPSFRTSGSWIRTTGASLTGRRTQQRAHVCVIGSEAKTKLFSGAWAVGQTIRLNGVLFTIVGVLAPKMQEGENNDRNRQIYVPFSTMSDIKDTKYLDGIWFNYRGNYQTGRKADAGDPGGCASLSPDGS